MEEDAGLEDLECCDLLFVRGVGDDIAFWEDSRDGVVVVLSSLLWFVSAGSEREAMGRG